MRLQRPIICGDALGQLWRGIPSVEITPGGRLFVCWYSGGEREPDPRNAIFLQTSDDRGDTFSAPVCVVDPPGATRAYDACLWLDPGGVLWLFWNQSNRERREYSLWAACCAQPDASALRWSEPRRLALDVPFCFRLNKPTVLTTGEWLLPVTWAREAPAEWFAGDAQLQGVARSHDGGATWELCGAVEVPPWALENMVIERQDGTLLMYIRGGGGVIWQCTSEDGGLTWGPVTSTEIPNPGSRFFLGRLASGRWLLLNSPDPKARTGLTAHLSADEGGSWGPGLFLDEREQVSYPDAAQGADGTIYAVYDRERYGAREILLAAFREEDLSI